jgi:hypothetical protein
MSVRLFSARTFTLVAGVAYAGAVYLNCPLFRYYPLVNRLSLHDLADRNLGPAMNWYGWLASAAIPALFVAAVVPKRLGDRIPAAMLWIVPFIMLLAGWCNERAWFVLTR